MKTLIFLLGVVVVAAFSGCAMATKEPVVVSRFVEAKPEAMRTAWAKVMKENEFAPMADGRWERVWEKKKDPILGLVTVSDEAAATERIAFSLESNGRGLLVTIVPVMAFRKMMSDGFSELAMKPGAANHARISNLLDTAIAKAQFTSAP